MNRTLSRLPLLLGAAAFSAAFLVGSLALSQGAPPPPKPGGVCKDDIAALCPNIQPGPGAHRAIARCLESQTDKLSAPCKAKVDEMKAKAEAAREACRPDVEKFCANVPAGGGQILQCLKQHQNELSDACKAQQGKHRRPPPPPAQQQQ